MTTSTIRVAPENHLYRLVEREDLVAGAEIIMVDSDAMPYEFESPFRRIQLQEDPVSDRGKGDYVRYDCIYPQRFDGCFVPLDEFLAIRQDPRSAHYWLAIN